ncbi:MAG: hypothetical protein HYU58_05580 [Proteobacteria bacterium]|nr:hypothetical protein [Pseudomonadota bacterium]
MVRIVSLKKYADNVSTVINILSGAATVAAAVVGIYAFFGTDLAEELTRQLNTQIAALNEEKIDLLRTKGDLESQIAAAEQERTASLRDGEKLEADIKELEEGKSSQIAHLEALQEEQKALTAKNQELSNKVEAQLTALAAANSDLIKVVDENHRAVIELAVNNIEFHAAWAGIFGPYDLMDIRNEALAAGSIVEYREWQRQSDANVLPPNATYEQYEAYSRRFGALYESRPEGWEMLRLKSDKAKAAPRSDDDVVAALRRQLSDTTRKLTGMKFVEEYLLNRDAVYVRYSKSNDAKVRALIERYLQDNRKLLNEDMMVIKPMTASDEEVQIEAKKVLKTIDGVQQLLKRMPDDMRGLLSMAQ